MRRLTFCSVNYQQAFPQSGRIYPVENRQCAIKVKQNIWVALHINPPMYQV